MSALLNTGRSDQSISENLTGCFRPQAAVRDLIFLTLKPQTPAQFQKFGFFEHRVI
jgi:hypothetical protein